MTTPDPAAPLTREDLDRLEMLLADAHDDGQAMPLDALQGLFFAIACGPEPVAPSRWMPFVLGAAREPAATDDARDARSLLMRFHDQCMAEAAADRFDLILYDAADGERDFATWCGGFLDGVELCDADWFERGDVDEVEELLYPFVVLAGELPARERRPFKPAEWRSLVRACEDGLADAIVDVREYWNVLRAPVSTIRRLAPKPGRNDPCPCGSGKKYKHCCGAPAKLQ